mmetsp:Transcript_59141/g.136466  ORF Transcript_59141/g.136466 Transcript_59141/m.136466 type:complete len:163 (+) Transcript_59141:135-623(+)
MGGYGEDVVAGLSEEQRLEFTECFKLHDKMNSGLLSPFELGILMRSLGHGPTDDEMNKIITEYEVYSKGGINVQDFLHVMAKREQDTAAREKLEEAFRVFDRDGNGYISKYELEALMKHQDSPSPYDDAEWKDFIAEAPMGEDHMIVRCHHSPGVSACGPGL